MKKLNINLEQRFLHSALTVIKLYVLPHFAGLYSYEFSFLWISGTDISILLKYRQFHQVFL